MFPLDVTLSCCNGNPCEFGCCDGVCCVPTNPPPSTLPPLLPSSPPSTTNPPTSSPSPKSSVPVVIIVASTVGGVFCIVCICITVCCWKRKVLRAAGLVPEPVMHQPITVVGSSTVTSSIPAEPPKTGDYVTVTTSALSTDAAAAATTTKTEIGSIGWDAPMVPYAELRFRKHLGNGPLGEVWLARYETLKSCAAKVLNFVQVITTSKLQLKRSS